MKINELIVGKPIYSIDFAEVGEEHIFIFIPSQISTQRDETDDGYVIYGSSTGTVVDIDFDSESCLIYIESINYLELKNGETYEYDDVPTIDYFHSFSKIKKTWKNLILKGLLDF